MSRDGALARASSLREALQDYGVRVSIELQTGRPGTPNGAWWDDRFIGSCGHHTVSRPSNGDTPCLALVKRGRSDVPGPLCNGYGGYDRIARLICMGWANHPGAGGPMRIGNSVIPQDQARPYLFGWEMEGGLETWDDAMHDFMARCLAATLDWIGAPTSAHVEHKTWAPTRKIDRLDYTATSARARIAAVRATRGDELSAADVAELKAYLDDHLADLAKASWGYPITNPLADDKSVAPAASLLRAATDRADSAAESASTAGGQVWGAQMRNPLDPEGGTASASGLLRLAADHAVQASLATREILPLLREIRDALVPTPPPEPPPVEPPLVDSGTVDTGAGPGGGG